jgi:cysteine desulfurase family protein (TIGR01976 family)
MLDIDFARSRFPALTDDWVLMDNAGGSVPLGGVIDRVTEYMRRIMVQLGASYRHSADAGEAVALGKRAAADLVNARPSEVVIGPSSTMNAKILAASLRPLWEEGDEIVVTDLDHETNIGPWRELEGTGIRVREWRYDEETCELRIEDLDPLLNDRTRLVCFTHCSNIVGTIHGAKAIVSRVHEAGAMACIDGVAFAPHRRVDVRDLDADFYLLSLYKVYGPHLGLMFGKREHWDRAASRNHFFIGKEEGTYRFEPGNVNHELTAALPAIPEYLGELSRTSGGDGSIEHAFDAIAEQESLLAEPVLSFLADRKGVRIVGRDATGPDRAPTISFVVEGRDSQEIPTALDEERVAIRYGHFYAYRAIERMGLLPQNGVVRISMVHYNTPGEVERLLEALDRAI